MKTLICRCLLGLVFWPGNLAFQVSSEQAFTPNELASIASRALLLLNSPEPAKRAWGAYLVGQNHLSELEPRLRQHLDQMDKIGENEILSILDAEIQLGTKLPPEIMKKIYGRYPNEATVLFSLSPIEYAEVILPFFEEEPHQYSTRISTRWLALGDLLSESKYPEFAKLLMRQMQNINLSVSVVDHLGGIGGGCGEGIGGKEINVPGDFPPIAVYDLLYHPERGALVLAPRPLPVYGLRKLIAPGERASIGGPQFFSCSKDPVPYWQEFLSSMLGASMAEVKFYTRMDLEWSNSKQFATKVRTYCQDILNKYEHIKSLMMDKKLISPSDAQSLEAHLFLKVGDFRKDKTHPIPEIHLDQVTVEK